MILGILLYMYPIEFFGTAFTSVILYFAASIYLTEKRAGDFKNYAVKDTAYTQVATDSLLNFETVKYFNAEGTFITYKL